MKFEISHIVKSHAYGEIIPYAHPNQRYFIVKKSDDQYCKNYPIEASSPLNADGLHFKKSEINLITDIFLE